MMDYVDVVLLKRTTDTDPYGNATTNQTEIPVARCLFEPQQSTERTDTRSPGVTSPAKLYLPPAVQVSSEDRVLIGAKTWEVIGDAASWGTAGTEVAIRRWGK